MEGTGVTIRRATLADLDALVPLVRGYREFYHQSHDAARERTFMELHLREGSSIVLIALHGERAVGFIQIFPTHSTVRLAPALILEDLFVMPDARGSGIASALLDAACDYARSIGAAGMFLETAMDNAAAQRVYERNGWTREGRFFKYNAPG